MKRIIALLVIVCCVFSLCSCGEKAEKALKENPASDFDYSTNHESAAIKEYIGTSKSVVIPEKIEGKPVTIIFTGAFMGKDVEKVVIPSTVTLIWDHAFSHCTSLKEVVFGDGITEIMEEGFYKCTALTEAILPEKLEKLGYRAFSDCSSLKKVSLPKNLEQMRMEVFFNCPIEELILEDGIKEFGSYASFWGATLKELAIPSSVEEIGEYSFHDNLEKVVFLGDAPKEVGDQPFGTKATVYYKKGTSGWDNTPLREEYTLVEQ